MYYIMNIYIYIFMYSIIFIIYIYIKKIYIYVYVYDTSLSLSLSIYIYILYCGARSRADQFPIVLGVGSVLGEIQRGLLVRVAGVVAVWVMCVFNDFKDSNITFYLF